MRKNTHHVRNITSVWSLQKSCVCKEIPIYFHMNFSCTGPPALVTQVLMTCPGHLDLPLFPSRAVFPRVSYSRPHQHSHCRLIYSLSMAIYSLSMAVSWKNALLMQPLASSYPPLSLCSIYPSQIQDKLQITTNHPNQFPKKYRGLWCFSTVPQSKLRLLW